MYGKNLRNKDDERIECGAQDSGTITNVGTIKEILQPPYTLQFSHSNLARHKHHLFTNY